MSNQVPQQYELLLPRADLRDVGDKLVNDTGQVLYKGDIVAITGTNATSGVLKTTFQGALSWLFRASLATATGGRLDWGRFRVVVSDTIAVGEQGNVVGREPCVAMVRVTSSEDSTVAVDSAVLPAAGAVAGTLTLTAGVKVIARTLEDAVFATGVTEKLVPCELDGEHGYGAA